MDLGSLESIYKKFGAISSEVLVAGISFQLLQGLQYLHEEMHVIHRYSVNLISTLIYERSTLF